MEIITCCHIFIPPRLPPYLTTCMTSLISSPLAATAVATSTARRPVLKSLRASSLSLEPVSVDGGGGEALLAQVQAQEVRLPLCLHEDQGPLLLVAPRLVQNAGTVCVH